MNNIAFLYHKPREHSIIGKNIQLTKVIEFMRHPGFILAKNVKTLMGLGETITFS